MHEFLENITINDMLHYTPNVSVIIHSCGLRRVQEGKIMTYFSSKDCMNHIEISKYVFNFLVCYRLLFFYPDGGVDTIAISSDVYEPLQVQYVRFNDIYFKKVDDFILLMNSRRYLPLRATQHMTHITRGYDPSSGEAKYNYFGIRHFITQTSLLEPPYVDMCKNYGHLSLLTGCINDATSDAFNRSSPMSSHLNGSAKLITSIFLDADLKHSMEYINIIDRCKSMYPWKQCLIRVYSSSVDERWPWDNFTMSTLLQDKPSILVHSKPQMIFIDYMTFCLSCLGIWLGFSFLGVSSFIIRDKKHFHGLNVDKKLRDQQRMIELLLQGMNQQHHWICDMEANLDDICSSGTIRRR